GNDQPRKIYLGDKRAAADQAVRRLTQAVGEEGPGHQRREAEERIRNAIGRNLRQVPEEDTEYDHRKERLYDGPGSPECSLLVTNLDVAPDKKVEQLAVFPKVLKFERNPAFRRRYAQRRKFELRIMDCGL